MSTWTRRAALSAAFIAASVIASPVTAHFSLVWAVTGLAMTDAAINAADSAARRVQVDITPLPLLCETLRPSGNKRRRIGSAMQVEARSDLSQGALEVETEVGGLLRND